MGRSREGTDWAAVLRILTIYRLNATCPMSRDDLLEKIGAAKDRAILFGSPQARPPSSGTNCRTTQ